LFRSIWIQTHASTCCSISISRCYEICDHVDIKEIMPAKKSKSSDLVQKSPAEFFAENKNIAGFDNVRVDVLQPLSRRQI